MPPQRTRRRPRPRVGRRLRRRGRRRGRATRPHRARAGGGEPGAGGGGRSPARRASEPREAAAQVRVWGRASADRRALPPSHLRRGAAVAAARHALLGLGRAARRPACADVVDAQLARPRGGVAPDGRRRPHAARGRGVEPAKVQVQITNIRPPPAASGKGDERYNAQRRGRRAEYGGCDNTCDLAATALHSRC